jgi:hypothetical protein
MNALKKGPFGVPEHITFSTDIQMIQGFKNVLLGVRGSLLQR